MASVLNVLTLTCQALVLQEKPITYKLFQKMNSKNLKKGIGGRRLFF